MRALIYAGFVILLALVGYGAVSGQTDSVWQLSFFVLMAMSMMFLVADRQRPI